MTYEAAHKAATESNEPAVVIAERFGITERTVYRYRKGSEPARHSMKVRMRLDAIMAIVAEHRGDWSAITKACSAAGFARDQYYRARRMLLRGGALKPDDWPVRQAERVPDRHWKLVRAMVKAGATRTQIARCFNVTDHIAGVTIREAWALIELAAAK